MTHFDTAIPLVAQICRNVIVTGRRTSIRMEQVYWDELLRICEIERRHLHDIISEVDVRRGRTNLTAALRVFVLCHLQFCRAAAATKRTGIFDPSRSGPSADGDSSRTGMAQALDAFGPPKDANSA